MKAYSFKYNKKNNRFSFSDSGRHTIVFKSSELEEVASFITRKDISIRATFKDNNLIKKRVKVTFCDTCVWSLDKDGVMKSYHYIDSQTKPTYKNMAIEFPLVNGNSLFIWYEKGLVFYGKDRLSAKLINRDEVKFDFSYIKTTKPYT